MDVIVSDEQRKKLLSQMLLQAKQERQLTYRQMARKLGVSDVAVMNWVKGISLPGPKAMPMVAAFLGFTPTPFEQFLQGTLPSIGKLKEDRLRNLIARLPPEKQGEFLDLIEDLVQAWLKRNRSSEQRPAQEPQ